jgi:hypothetical protein
MSCRAAARNVRGPGGAVAWVQLQGMDTRGQLLVLEVKVKRDIVEWWLGAGRSP